MTLIYIAGSLEADQPLAEVVLKTAVSLIEAGFAPVFPLDVLELERDCDTHTQRAGALEQMSLCNAVLVVPGFESTADVVEAHRLCMPVFHSIDELNDADVRIGLEGNRNDRQ